MKTAALFFIANSILFAIAIKPCVGDGDNASRESRLLALGGSLVILADGAALERATIIQRRLDQTDYDVVSNNDTKPNANAESTSSHQTTETVEYANAILLPALTITIGSLVYYLLTRISFLDHFVPYTAAMFLTGTLMGIGTTLTTASPEKHFQQSVFQWTNIQAEVLLLVFLPGIVFKDATALNVHLFRLALWQNIFFALPLVLAGTVLTALVAYYLLPWEWPFNLCMTFGSILSATDPVAVSALMETLGAPPRLKVHIEGEALLNDASAIVFFSIFEQKYLFELGVNGVGKDIEWATGIAMFFQMSLGGVAVGLFFGLGILLLLKYLDRRFMRQENVTQVAAMLGLVYLNYFCADLVWRTSGVIATVVCGITISCFGQATINDSKTLDDFWTLFDNVLNTVLFTLGGIVWGEVLTRGGGIFNAKDWGYLIFLYIMMSVIRCALFLFSYPLVSRMGLGASWKETLFQIHSGLRGAVGIALALALDENVKKASATGTVSSTYEDQATQVFGVVGAMAFLTLVLNASTSKSLLHVLKLSQSSEARQKILNTHRLQSRKQLIYELTDLLSEVRFRGVEFPVIRSHVSFLSNLTKAELTAAVEWHRDAMPAEDYREPRLDGILPFICGDHVEGESIEIDEYCALKGPDGWSAVGLKDSRSTMSYLATRMPQDLQEFRDLFISALRSAYKQQISNGELAESELLTVSLEQSLDLAQDQAARGRPLCDWEFVRLVDPAHISLHQRCIPKGLLRGLRRYFPGAHRLLERSVSRFKIQRAMSFIAAHEYARSKFKKEFGLSSSELSDAATQVMRESEEQIEKAKAVLDQEDPSDVHRVVSHKFCCILLNRAAKHVHVLVEQGLLKEEEAEDWVSDITKELEGVYHCREMD